MRKGMSAGALALMGGIALLLLVLIINAALDPTSGFRDFLKKVPWLNKIVAPGSSDGDTTPAPIPTDSFKDYPSWSSLSISPTAPAIKWSSPTDSADACKVKIESLFDPVKNPNFNSFRDICLYATSDFLSEPFDLGTNCKVEASTLVSYVSSVCRSQVGVFGLDHRTWLLPTKNCGQTHRDKFNDIRFNCGLDNVCSGVVRLYYNKDDKGVGICDGNSDIPAIKDAPTAKTTIIKWLDDRIKDSEQSGAGSEMCDSFSDCTMVINIPEPGIPINELTTAIIENVRIDMGVDNAFADGAKYLEYGSGKPSCGSCWLPWNLPCCLSGGYVRDGVGLDFSFYDPAPYQSTGLAVPCAVPKSENLGYNCGSNNVCTGDIRVTYGCSFAGSCGKDNKQRFIGVCEKPP
ncbi:MAG: hypothetical protein V1836_03650 [Candidatus Aenigmatarchaeota archaeon]